MPIDAENIAKHPELYLPETLAKFKLGAGIDVGSYIKARLKLDQHSPSEHENPHRRGRASHANHPGPCTEGQRDPHEIRGDHGERFVDVAQHQTIQLIRSADDLYPVRVYQSRPANRLAAQRSAVAGSSAPSIGTQV
jgi:hypothetical protein